MLSLLYAILLQTLFRSYAILLQTLFIMEKNILRLNFYGHVVADGCIYVHLLIHIYIYFIYLAKIGEMLLNVRKFNFIPISCSWKTSTNTNINLH